MTYETSASDGVPERPVLRSVRRGLAMRCPNCGAGSMFDGYLRTREASGKCGEHLHHHRADDAHPYLTILVLGHMILPWLMSMDSLYELPLWILWLGSTTAITVMALALLRPMKGLVVALQWALRMHGFGGHGG